jgi:hypothetical protein
MKANQRLAVLSIFVFASVALPASAADRVRAGQWAGTTIAGGRTFPTSSCISQGDADAINGDATAVQAYLEKIIPPSICKISDISAQGSQIIYTASCASAASKVVTTTYHGDSSEGTDNKGSKTEAKRIGPCT